MVVGYWVSLRIFDSVLEFVEGRSVITFRLRQSGKDLDPPFDLRDSNMPKNIKYESFTCARDWADVLLYQSLLWFGLIPEQVIDEHGIECSGQLASTTPLYGLNGPLDGLPARLFLRFAESFLLDFNSVT